MSDVTRILNALQGGERQAGEELLLLVYEDLRRLAAAMLEREPPGQTLQSTALVHEAWLRLQNAGAPGWEGRRHFFAAAAEAMRRILVDNARRKHAVRHGGGLHRTELSETRIAGPLPEDQLLAINEALDRLAAHAERKAELVKLRYFAGLTLPQAAEVLGISEPTAKRDWAYARAWLYRELGKA